MAYCILKSYKLNVPPFKIFEALSREKHCFFLDSSLNSNYFLARFSFLGVDPFLIINADGVESFKKIKELFKLYNISNINTEIPFLGGAVGYFSYDLGLKLEKKIQKKDKDGLVVPECFLGFYNSAIIIDHLKQRLYIFSAGFPEKGQRLAKLLAQKNFKRIQRLLYNSNADFRRLRAPYNPVGIFTGHADSRRLKNLRVKETQLTSNFTKEEYIAAIKKAKDYIRSGDIYQVNLSQLFKARTNFSALEIYQRLRKISPAWYSAYLDAGDFQILSSSPELFLRLQGNTVITRPMKGTRPRSQDKPEDKKLKQELLESAKDKAELTMIVDLERNDLGRVCKYDSIKVEKLREIEEYSTVFQTTATVSGRLHKNKDRIDLLRACFPGGSITGCPKIRAMEIIEELEPSRRSIYTGSLGYLSFSGNMELNILIRTILKRDAELCFGVGGGIIADSNPKDEYEETLVKARGMIEAISA